LSYRVLTQKKRQEAPKVYSLHAPEVECIGKGKAHKPYEFGVKVSVATTVSASKGDQFIVHAKTLPGNPYDGHTLETVLRGIEAITGATLSRILTDAGYKGHNAPKEHKFKVYTQGQKRGVTQAIKAQLKRRATIEPLIGHAKDDHRLGRNFLAHRQGDAINAVLAAAGYNFRRFIQWLRLVLRMILNATGGAQKPQFA
jgi:IS5 family transposase